MYGWIDDNGEVISLGLYMGVALNVKIVAMVNVINLNPNA